MRDVSSLSHSCSHTVQRYGLRPKVFLILVGPRYAYRQMYRCLCLHVPAISPVVRTDRNAPHNSWPSPNTGGRSPWFGPSPTRIRTTNRRTARHVMNMTTPHVVSSRLCRWSPVPGFWAVARRDVPMHWSALPPFGWSLHKSNKMPLLLHPFSIIWYIWCSILSLGKSICVYEQMMYGITERREHWYYNISIHLHRKMT